MAKVYLFLADGCEEIEALTPVDLLRRAGEEVVTVSVMGRLEITGSHNIRISADAEISEIDMSDADLLVLPGGQPGTRNLEACEPLKKAVLAQIGQGRKVAAICAAPTILGHLGLAKGRNVVCFPGLEAEMKGGNILEVPAVTDGQITTGRGMGAALWFGLALIRELQGEEAANRMAEKIVFPCWKE